MAALPRIFSEHTISVTRYVPDGERRIEIEFVGVQVEQPKFLESDGTSHAITPIECLRRNLTYGVPIYSNVHVTSKTSYVLKNVFLGIIPLMLGSRHDPNTPQCPYDVQGGYFIVKGSEKSVIFQKAHSHNTILTLRRKCGQSNAYAVCCKSESTYHVAVTTIKWSNNKAMVSFPKLKVEITVGTLLSLLPESSFIELDDDETAFFADSMVPSEIQVQDTFMLGEAETDRIEGMLAYCLPHTRNKADYVKLMLKQLYMDMHKGHCSDKDALMFQRIEMVHDLLSALTHTLLNKATHTVRQFLHRKLVKKVTKQAVRKLLLRTTTLTDGLVYALGTGNWNTPTFDGRQRVGVAQLLQRGTVYTAVSQLRRVSSSIKPEQKLSKPRFLHGQHRGRLCYLETPEGAAVGLESQLALGAYVSITSPVNALEQWLTGTGDKIVFVNGSIHGRGDQKLAALIRYARRTGQISKDVSVTVDCPTVCVPNICIRTNSGRICRPLYILPKTKTLDSFTEMLSQGIVEYLDVYEEYSMLIGTTHAEIDPSLMLGFCAATIPYSDHNPAPRNTYQIAMLKQAQSVNTTVFAQRLDTTNHVLHYGQKALVSTRVERAYRHNLPTGQNCIVAIMAYKYNQEDSIILNQASVDRGLWRTTTLKTVKDSLCRDETYAQFPKVNTLVKKGDVLIRKIRRAYIPKKGKRVAVEQDVSVTSPHDGVVDTVFLYKERDGSQGCKVRLRKERIPTLGDKGASRSAQKGTVGMFVPQEDMPRTVDGITPDLILNPHAIPSRMTMAQIFEALKSKFACFSGLQDGSPFNGDTAEGLMKALRSVGFRGDGTQTMFDGITGRKFDAKIFIAPTFYQRLKHNSEDKIHARAKGKKNMLTRQPNEGRANGGALRLGEMEKDAFISHSVPFVLNERLMTSSDEYKMEVCPQCGDTTSVRGGTCIVCNTASRTMTVPYAFKLLNQELASMCINLKLK